MMGNNDADFVDDCVAVGPSYGRVWGGFQGINFSAFETFCGSGRVPATRVVPANAGTHTA